MAGLPSSLDDPKKSLRYLLAGIFLVLVLIEKSMGFQPNTNSRVLPTSGFKNVSTTFSKPKISEEAWEDDLGWEEEALEKAFPAGKDPGTKVSLLDDTVPEITLPEDRFPGPSKPLQVEAGYLPLYFLKFYGTGKNSNSQLVKVTREFSGGDPIPFLFQSLLQGPNSEEKAKGILSALPKKTLPQIQYRLENGILHLSLPKAIGGSGSMEILKDRLDQITFTYVGNFGIRSLVLYLEGERMRSLGSEGLFVPEFLVKTDRKVLVF